MKRLLIAFGFPLLLSFAFVADAVSPENASTYSGTGVSLRLAREEGSVLNPGEEISLQVEAGEAGYPIVFNIDSEGFVNLLYPEPRAALTPLRKGQVLEIPESPVDRLLVDGTTGIEFVFALLVPDEDYIDRGELEFLARSSALPRDERYRVDGDPLLAANVIAGETIRGISHRKGVYLDYSYFYVNERVPYPCYLCGECDGGAPDADCTRYLVTANFDQKRPFTYPLRRAYDLVERTEGEEEEGLASRERGEPDRYVSDDGTVEINFYPYASEVYYGTRQSLSGASDIDFYLYGWDPLWYDPWLSGWYYYPSYWGNYYWGYPWGWGFGFGFYWGYGGGYYCSNWYYPSCYGMWDWYDCNYGYGDGYYGYRPDRYKEKYRSEGSGTGGGRYKEPGASSTYRNALAHNTARDSRLKVAAGDVRTGGNTAVRTASLRSKVGRNSAVASRTRSTPKAYTKTARVRGQGDRLARDFDATRTRAQRERGADVRTQRRAGDRTLDRTDRLRDRSRQAVDRTMAPRTSKSRVSGTTSNRSRSSAVDRGSNSRSRDRSSSGSGYQSPARSSPQGGRSAVRAPSSSPSRSSAPRSSGGGSSRGSSGGGSRGHGRR